MTSYKLRVPTAGDELHGDSDTVFVADTREQARALYEEDRGEPCPYLHSYIGSCRVVYARDVENGDCHEDAEPGDTTVDYCHDSGRELRPHECRVWVLGAPRLARWKMEPLLPEPIGPETIPAGAPVLHQRIGWGQTNGAAFKACGAWYLPCEFKSRDGRRLNCEIRARAFGVHYSASFNSAWRPPPTRYRLTINGEHVADGSEQMLHHLVDIREARLRAEWEAEQDREMAHAVAT